MNIFLRFPGIILAVFRFAIVIISLAVVVLFGVILVKLKWADQHFAFGIRKNWCRFAVFLLGVRIHKSGTLIENPGTLFVGNHRSILDPIVVFSMIRDGFVVSKAEVESYPIVNTGAKLSGVVYVQRDNAESRKSTKQSIVELLEQHQSVLVFPEGTTPTTTQTLPFKRGSFEAAAQLNKPVVAFALEMGNPQRDLWHGDGFFDLYFQSISKWTTDVYIHFFDPVKSNSGEQLANEVEFKVNEQLRVFQNHWPS